MKDEYTDEYYYKKIKYEKCTFPLSAWIFYFKENSMFKMIKKFWNDNKATQMVLYIYIDIESRKLNGLDNAKYIFN